MIERDRLDRRANKLIAVQKQHFFPAALAVREPSGCVLFFFLLRRAGLTYDCPSSLPAPARVFLLSVCCGGQASDLRACAGAHTGMPLPCCEHAVPQPQD